MVETTDANGDVESRTNDGDLRWRRVSGAVQYGAVPESTPRTIAVGVDGDGAERDLAVDADGVTATLENNSLLRSLTEENNALARALVQGMTEMTETDLLAETDA